LKTAKKYIPGADADPTDTDHLSGFSKHMNWYDQRDRKGFMEEDSRTANWITHSNYSLTMGRFEICQNSPRFGARIFLWRGYRLGG
jgi:hypothetical protein